jgi:DNA repair protein RadD
LRRTSYLLLSKSKVTRKGILVFTRFVKEAQKLAYAFDDCAVVTGETPKAERERILADFKSGRIKVVANAGVLTTGFDYPELDTIVMARPTKSLALWYQIVGRAIRPCKGKVGWIVDLCGNYQQFGRVEDLRIDKEDPNSSRWCIKSNGRQLTNVNF